MTLLLAEILFTCSAILSVWHQVLYLDVHYVEHILMNFVLIIYIIAYKHYQI